MTLPFPAINVSFDPFPVKVSLPPFPLSVSAAAPPIIELLFELPIMFTANFAERDLALTVLTFELTEFEISTVPFDTISAFAITSVSESVPP